MLVLAYKVGEKVIIDVPPGVHGRIILECCQSQFGRDRVGITAPRKMRILREKHLYEEHLANLAAKDQPEQ